MKRATFRERMVGARLRSVAETQIAVLLCAQAVQRQPAELAAWLSLLAWRHPSPLAEAILRDRYRRLHTRH